MLDTPDTFIKEEIDTLLDKLNTEALQRVLEFTRTLSPGLPKGVPGAALLQFSGIISAEDARLMSEAIEEGCEQVDLSEW